MTALGAEVVWTRLLSLTFGGTVYAFSIILAVFLFGLGIGSSIGSLLARRNAGAAAALGWCQFLLAAAVAWTAFMLAKSLPIWPIDPTLTTNPWFELSTRSGPVPLGLAPGDDFVGREFSARASGGGGARAGRRRLVGGIYAANTVGGILGGIGFSIIFIPLVGTQQSERLLIDVIRPCAALLIFISLLLQRLKNVSPVAALLSLGLWRH